VTRAVEVAVDLALWRGKIAAGETVTASWKHEYEDRSGAYGPLRLACAGGAEWDAPGWISVEQAREIADALDLALQEW
jgi:hypothetical protein